MSEKRKFLGIIPRRQDSAYDPARVRHLEARNLPKITIKEKAAQVEPIEDAPFLADIKKEAEEQAALDAKKEKNTTALMEKIDELLIPVEAALIKVAEDVYNTRRNDGTLGNDYLYRPEGISRSHSRVRGLRDNIHKSDKNKKGFKAPPKDNEREYLLPFRNNKQRETGYISKSHTTDESGNNQYPFEIQYHVEEKGGKSTVEPASFTLHRGHFLPYLSITLDNHNINSVYLRFSNEEDYDSSTSEKLLKLTKNYPNKQETTFQCTFPEDQRPKISISHDNKHFSYSFDPAENIFSGEEKTVTTIKRTSIGDRDEYQATSKPAQMSVDEYLQTLQNVLSLVSTND